MRELNFQLSTSIEYAHGGNVTSSALVVLKAPTSKQRKECAFLKQAFFRTINDNKREVDDEKLAAVRERLKESKTKEDDDLLKGEEIMMMIASSMNVSFDEFLEVGRRLLQSGVAMIGGEEKLSGKLIDDMEMDDFEKMLGEYLAFFILQSAMTLLKNI